MGQGAKRGCYLVGNGGTNKQPGEKQRGIQLTLKEYVKANKHSVFAPVEREGSLSAGTGFSVQRSGLRIDSW